MIFTEVRFIVFMAFVFGVYWYVLRWRTSRDVFLLGASYAFYAAWDVRFLSLILVSTLIDYWIGCELGRERLPRRALVVASICANLGILGFFKYYNFFADSFAELMTSAGVPTSASALAVMLPVGISFYTFQTMSYTIDVYRGRQQPITDLLELSLFVAFFPQLVAGPIVKAVEFFPQLSRHRRLSEVPLRAMALLFLVGFVKKAVLSDNVAMVVDSVYAEPSAFTAGAVAVAATLYSIQIYCDFSGYSDMAIATAGLLGFRLPENFDQPYLSTSIRDFWRRWHISLSSWLREYLYVPLGGNRHGRWKRVRNLVTTMLLGGLWHGASWNFVAWGGLHGLALALHSWVRSLPATVFLHSFRGWKVFSWFATYAFVCVAWILFRSSTTEDAWQIFATLIGVAEGGTQQVSPLWMVTLLFLPLEWAWQRWGQPTMASSRSPGWLFACGYGATWALLLPLVPRVAKPFIYFQF